MLNKQFKAEIISVTLHAGGDEKAKSHGATIQAQVALQDPAFIEDLGYGDKLKGLKSLIGGDIPVDGDVPLKFSHKAFEFGMEGMAHNESAELVSVVVTPGDDVSATMLKIKVKLPKVSSKNWPVVSTALKETLKIKLVKRQEELALGEGEEE